MQIITNIYQKSLDNTQESIVNRIETLRSVVMLLLSEIDSLEESVLVDAMNIKEAGDCLPEKLERIEIDTIRCALIKTSGQQKLAAKLLGIKHTTLNSKIKKYKIDWRLPKTNENFFAQK